MRITRVIVPRDLIPADRLCAEKAALRVTDLIIRHLRKKNESTAPNPFGLPKSNYYAKAADTAQYEVSGKRFVVSVGSDSMAKDAPGRGLALHYEGGTVYPKRGKRLAVPVNPAVAGIWPSEYRREIFFTKSAIGDKESGNILWLLIPKATIPADPSVLPTDEEIANAASLGTGEVMVA